jgi:hypothetical protein
VSAVGRAEAGARGRAASSGGGVVLFTPSSLALRRFVVAQDRVLYPLSLVLLGGNAATPLLLYLFNRL